MEEERREHVMKMKKMEAEMEQVFEMKVKEKKQKLKDSEAEVGLSFSVCLSEKNWYLCTCVVKYMHSAFMLLHSDQSRSQTWFN